MQRFNGLMIGGSMTVFRKEDTRLDWLVCRCGIAQGHLRIYARG
jgi:hypothetical protein